MVLPNDEESEELRAEVRVFATYLVGTAPELSLSERYVAACRKLLEPGTEAEQAAVAWAVRHPGALAHLDGAAGLLRPDSLLRRKLLLVAALLEATPRHADAFLPVRSSAPGLVLRLAWTGIAAAYHALVGAVLLRIAERPQA